MVSLTRDDKGGWHSRKRLPSAVKADYHRLHGQRHEVKFFAPSSTPEREAKRLWSEWQAETEGRIAAIIAAQKGEGLSLTHRQARALAGDWYLWFVERHPVADEPHWADLRERVHEALTAFVSSEEEAQDPDTLYRDRRVREAIGPVLADIGETAQFLALKGIALSNEARALFLGYLYDDLAAALRRLIRYATGRHRDGVKKLFNALLFDEGSRTKFPKATNKLFPKGTKVGDVIAAIHRKHPPLASELSKGIGHQLMFLESQLMTRILQRLKDLQIVALPIFDAVLVKASCASHAKTIMTEEFKKLTGIKTTVRMEGPAARQREALLAAAAADL